MTVLPSAVIRTIGVVHNPAIEGGLMSTYIYDQAWHAEHERLLAIEDHFDDYTRFRLATLGVGEGWRCLEVGCGAGGVARWLAEQVGPSGHVVATDLDPRFIESEQRDNLEVRAHNIVTDPLEEGVYDLVHARAVLEHIPERERALERMVAATRPGGWVVIEDVDFGGVVASVAARYTFPPEHAALFERMVRAFDALFAAIGADGSFGSRLPRVMLDAGLVSAGAEFHSPFAWGGAERHFIALSMQHLRVPLVRAGLLSEEEIETFINLTKEPSFGSLILPMVTAWGQRPAD